MILENHITVPAKVSALALTHGWLCLSFLRSAHFPGHLTVKTTLPHPGLSLPGVLGVLRSPTPGQRPQDGSGEATGFLMSQ